MADVFAFRDSTSIAAESDILSTMENIKETLETNRKAINTLKPEWVAVEADAYYAAISKWNEGAEGLASVLKSVEQTLAHVRNETGDLKHAIKSILDATK
ncbi:MAG: hypothetical protein Q4A82_07275 [Corynebacterium sp.]|nr:hypothetical protein [Corynebacterium sp.]